MKINPILQKIESYRIANSKKTSFWKNVKKGDIVSVIYFDIEKEQTRLQQFTGICSSFKSAGMNTKISVVNVLDKIVVEQQFFLFSNVVIDVMIVRKKSK